jgi:PAS domain S-box-containing protein
MPFRAPESPFPSQAAALPNEASFIRLLRKGTLLIAVGIGLPALALLGLVIYLLHSTALISRTDEMIASAHSVEKLMIDMETGLRGYQVTGDKRFLEPLEIAQRRIDDQLNALSSLTAHDPGQTLTFTALRREIDSWRTFAAEALRPENDGANARLVAFQLSGKAMMDDVRARIAELAAGGSGVRAAQMRSALWVRWILALGLALAGVVGGPVSGIWLRRSLGRIAGSYERGLALAKQHAEQLHITLRSIGDAVVATNAAGEVIFLNPIAERLMGWKTAEAQGHPLTEVFLIFNEQTGAPAENPVARVLRERIVVGLANHTVIRSRNGAETPIEDSAAPILDDKGRILGVILVFHDVGAKREIEMRLQQAEWRSRTALEIGGAGSWVWEVEQDRITGDAMVARTFGIPLERCRAGEKVATFLASIHEEDSLRVETTIRRAIDTSGSYETEFGVRNGAGESRWVQARGRMERGANGRQSRLVGFIIDTTTARKAEDSLRESEQRFRFLHKLGEMTRTLSDPQRIMVTVAHLLGDHLAASRCAYAEVEADGNQFRILDDYTRDCASAIGEYHVSDFGPRAADDMCAGRTLVITNADEELAGGVGADAFKAIGARAVVCCPLIREDSLRAMMAVHQTTQRHWTTAEIELVREVAERSWSIIERARAEAEVRERSRLSVLRADIAAQLVSGDDLERSLQACCEFFVHHLGAAFARVWTLGPGETVLELRASAGIYTHLDGPHARVPVGQFKIGRIAQNQRALLTNAVAGDPNISDPEWAKREGMVAFAGYPLLAEERTVGVLAMFARQTLSATALADLAPIADTLALCIERKRAEAELRTATERAERNARDVAESAGRFRLLAEVVSIQVWTARADGELDFANQECANYFGTDELERDVLGHAWAQYVHPEDAPDAQRAWKESLASGKRYEVEFRLKDLHGRYHWFLVRAQAMRDEAGGIAKWFGTNTDINALKVAQNEAERANRAKDEFLAALSHELRTPLTPVLMTASALRGDASLPPAVREQLGMMERNIALEARLIDDLLDLTRIARGKLNVRPQPCDAHSLIGLAIEIVRDEALAKSISIRREFGARKCGLTADPARFQQVIWNLLRNAVKFTPRGGNITVSTRDEQTSEAACRLRIEVIDSGIGITSAQLENIFLPFEQGGLAGDHRFGGIGLGLAIARAIVDLHGGNIRATSEGPNCGATFVVEFPGAIEPPAGALEAPEALIPQSGSRPHPVGLRKPLRLLLVEDHEPSLQVMSRLLTKAGHYVIAANSLSAALTAASAGKFDLVISDLGLPDGTGAELMQQLRATYGLNGIALSGYGMDEDLARSREAGFMTHLIKPVDFHQLERALREFTWAAPAPGG